MMRVLARISFLVLACAAGIACAELLVRMPAARGAVAKAFGGGELIAIVNGAGIYQAPEPAEFDHDATTAVVAENLRRAARGETADEAEIERELALLRHQFPHESAFANALESSGLSLELLRERASEHLRARAWLEKRIAPQLEISEADARQFYDENPAQFDQPQRFRASHLLLAAHAQTPPEAVDAKRRMIDLLARRIAKEKNLAQLAMEISEDEATKPRGGDLGVFAEARMLPEFFAEVAKLRPGQTSPQFQTPLGFHIVQVTGSFPQRQLSFVEARPEITTGLMNEQRAAAVAALAEQLSTAEFIRAAR
ncbi:MAG: peptidylprolyl isomerase [Chthoniobacterales bacterium]|nr:peptidylprolyl isomerase [Chthoniobacterales bacterium]